MHLAHGKRRHTLQGAVNDANDFGYVQEEVTFRANLSASLVEATSDAVP